MFLFSLFELLIGFRYVTNGKYYQDSLKGMFCAKTNISLIIQENQDHRELSIKPFLMQIWIGLMFLGLVYFFFFSALNYRSYHLQHFNKPLQGMANFEVPLRVSLNYPLTKNINTSSFLNISASCESK